MLSRFFGPGTGLATQADPFGTFQREMNRVFDEVFRGFPAASRGAATMGGFAPSLDVHETEAGLEIAAELPGMSEQDVELRLEGDLLTLAGEKQAERKQDQGGLHMTERSFGRFQRSFRLPFRPDPNQVQAQFDKGVLRVALPRPQQQRSGGRVLSYGIRLISATAITAHGGGRSALLSRSAGSGIRRSGIGCTASTPRAWRACGTSRGRAAPCGSPRASRRR